MSDLVFEGKPYSHEFGKFEIRRWYAQSQDILTNETWKTSGLEYPQRKVIVGAVVKTHFLVSLRVIYLPFLTIQLTSAMNLAVVLSKI